MDDIWTAISGEAYIAPKSFSGYRIVEDQNKSVTRKLVDSETEHDVLEDLIDGQKPPYPSEAEHLDYLLRTPFRYPPLNDATRYCRTTDPSLFYGALELQTAFIDKAYRQRKLALDTHARFRPMTLKMTSFLFEVASARHCDLTTKPFAVYTPKLVAPKDYSYTHKLADNMRQHNVQSFFFPSARCSEHKPNIGVIDFHSFANSKPKQQMQWELYFDYSSAEFRRSGKRTNTFSHRFKDVA